MVAVVWSSTKLARWKLVRLAQVAAASVVVVLAVAVAVVVATVVALAAAVAVAAAAVVVVVVVVATAVAAAATKQSFGLLPIGKKGPCGPFLFGCSTRST